MGADEDASDISVRDQASISLAGNVLDAAVSFGGVVLIANVLGAAGLGRFYLVLAVVKVALFPVEGMGQAIMKRGSESGSASPTPLGAGLVFSTVYAGVVVLGLAAVLRAVQLPPGYGPAVVGSAVLVFLSRSLFVLLLDAYRATGRTGYATLVDNAHGVLETAVQVLFLLAGLQVVGLLLGTAVVTVAVGVGLVLLTPVSVERPTWKLLGSVWQFGRWSTLSAGLGTVYDRLPVLLLGVTLGSIPVGYYTSAMRLLMLGSYLGGSIAPALMVRTSAGGSEDVLSDYGLSLQYASLLSVPLLFGSLAMPETLMGTVFGPTFRPAGTVLVGLGVYHVVNTYATVTASFLDGIDRPAFGTIATFVSLVVRAVAAAALLVTSGLGGVVVAVVLSHFVQFLTHQYFVRREFGTAVLPVRAGRQLLAATLMYWVVVRLTSLAPVASWAHLLGVVGVGAVCYVVALVGLDGVLRQILRDGIREHARFVR